MRCERMPATLGRLNGQERVPKSDESKGGGKEEDGDGRMKGETTPT